MRLFKSLFFALAVIFFATTDLYGDVMTFEEIAPFTQYSVGDVITSGGFSLEVGGNPNTNTLTQVTSSGFVGNGLESYADRELEFLLVSSTDFVSFQFGNFGGTNFMVINGVSSGTVFGFDQLNGQTVGGVDISTSGFRTNGLVELNGTINSLTISGQELLVDNITVNVVPEPSVMLPASLGLFGLAVKRRKKMNS